MDKMGNITLYNDDCMNVMKTFPDNYFDLAIVDPPYGIGADNPSKKPSTVKQKNGRFLNIDVAYYGKKNWDSCIPKPEYFDELKRISKNQIIFGVNYFKYDLSGGRIVWDKLNGDSDQYGCEIAYCSFNNRTDIVYYMWRGMFQGCYCGTDITKTIVQQGNKLLNEKRIHPTQKPVLLYKWLLIKYAKEGYIIFDSHFGSGSLGIAAHDLNYTLVAVEKDKEICESAKKRISNHQKQLNLF